MQPQARKAAAWTSTSGHSRGCTGLEGADRTERELAFEERGVGVVPDRDEGGAHLQACTLGEGASRVHAVCMPCRVPVQSAVQSAVWAWAAGSMHLEQRLSELQCAAAVGGRRLRAHARVRERTSGALEAGDGGVPQDADAAVREHAVGQRAA